MTFSYIAIFKSTLRVNDLWIARDDVTRLVFYTKKIRTCCFDFQELFNLVVIVVFKSSISNNFLKLAILLPYKLQKLWYRVNSQDNFRHIPGELFWVYGFNNLSVVKTGIFFSIWLIKYFVDIKNHFMKIISCKKLIGSPFKLDSYYFQ